MSLQEGVLRRAEPVLTVIDRPDTDRIDDHWTFESTDRVPPPQRAPINRHVRRHVRPRRTRQQKLTAFAVILTASLFFFGASVLATGRWLVQDRQVIQLASPAKDAPHKVVVGGVDPTDRDLSGNTTQMDLAEPEASNFLVTGADNGDCAGQNDPTVGPRSSERSDTVMIWRLNPQANQLAVLSIPRDLWVKRPGGSPSRINRAYKPNDPRELIETIKLNFDISIDHYIQVDFCAFRTLVNAVGGVAVPFDFPAQDPASLLNIPQTGCVTLNGDMALAYVRSRHYRYEDPVGSGNWHTDGTSDFGRIARQQDFLRRVVAKTIGDGLYNPAIAGGLIKTNSDYIITDAGLSVRSMLEFINALRDLNPSQISTYRVESVADHVGGAAIERPRIKGDNMQAILEVFRGNALLADAPDQQFQTPTTLAGPQTAPPTNDAGSVPATAPNQTDSTVPPTSVVNGATVVNVESNNLGISPNPNVICP